METFLRIVRKHDRYSAGREMPSCCRQGGNKIIAIRHMIYCVVNDHGVEFATEPCRAHITKNVLHAGVAPATDRQHRFFPVQ